MQTQTNSSSISISAADPGDGRKAGSIGAYVIAALLGLSLVIGVIAYWRFTLSDRYLAQDFAQMTALGPKLTAEGCVDETLKWAEGCRAMKSLCDASVPRMMEACLAGQDRRGLCLQLGSQVLSASYGFADCQQRALPRKTKKACGLAYRAIADHCEYRLVKEKQ